MFSKQTYAQLIASLVRFRLALIAIFCLLAGVSALVVVPIVTRSASAAESACTLPGITVVTDAANDQNAAGAGDQDLLSVSFAEPADPVADRLYVTMKVRGPVAATALPP
ncbi:MAG: hypothetical protein QOD33_187, partial [Pyrinomonadaceae bacterium]|nr:hypothetical protein [Pyrinomonadaceae bacterium]